jgi:hypothetical protein
LVISVSRLSREEEFEDVAIESAGRRIKWLRGSSIGNKTVIK